MTVMRNNFSVLFSMSLAAGLITNTCQMMMAQVASAEQPPAANQAATENHRLSYARTYLKFAEVNLKRAELRNESVPGIVPESEMEKLREEVGIAKKLLKSAETGTDKSETSDFHTYLRFAEALYFVALEDWRRAKTIHEQDPNAESELDVECLRLRTEMSRLEFEKGKSLVDGSFEQQTRWKLDVLCGEVIRLREQAAQPR